MAMYMRTSKTASRNALRRAAAVAGQLEQEGATPTAKVRGKKRAKGKRPT